MHEVPESTVLRLSALEVEPEMPAVQDAWFKIGEGARRPAACPVGVVADYLVPKDVE
jgi:hypothetical protein